MRAFKNAVLSKVAFLIVETEDFLKDALFTNVPTTFCVLEILFYRPVLLDGT